MKTCIVGLGCAALLLCARFAVRADSIASTSGRPLLAPIESKYTPVSGVSREFDMSAVLDTSLAGASCPVLRDAADTSCSISHGPQNPQTLNDRCP